MNKTQREALKVLKAVAPRNASIPILSHTLLGVEGARVTDLEVMASVSAAALGVEVEGTGALRVTDLALALEAGATKLSFEGSKCVWSGGSFVALPAEDFPVPGPHWEKGNATKDASGLPAAFAMVERAMCKDGVRYSLNGAALTPSGQVVATNGHRLHLAQGGVVGLDKETWIVPALAVKILAGVRGPLSVERYGDVLVFDSLTFRLSARRLEGSFPNHERVVSWPENCRWAVDAKEFLEETAGLYKFVRSASNAAVKVTANGVLGLVGERAESGSMAVSVPLADVEGTATFGVNLGYLRDAVEAIGGRVEMGYGGKASGNGNGMLKLRGERGEAVIAEVRI